MLLKKFFSSFSKIKTLDQLGPDLLINLSMLHQPQEFKSFDSLITHLKTAKILKSASVEKVLNKLSRSLFLPDEKLHKLTETFQIKPLNIGFNQTMTDIAVQCNCLEILSEEINRKALTGKPFKILDVGSGSGYMSFSLYLLASDVEISNFEGLLGIDIYDELINHCNSLMNKINVNQKKLSFETCDLDDFIDKSDKKFDIINIGFGVERNVINSLKNKILNNEEGVLLGPVIQEEEQALTLIKKEGETKIMNCFFSDKVMKNNKDDHKYFLKQGDIDEDLKENQEKIKGLTDEIKALEAKFKEVFQGLKEQKGLSGKTMTLKEMMENSEIKELLVKINKLKQVLKRL